MDTLTKFAMVLIGGVVIWGIWRAGQPRRIFIVRIVEGEPQIVTGKLTPAFLEFIREVAQRHDVASGKVLGLARGARIRLDFSRHFPEAGRQQLRNWWVESGWLASRPS